MLIGLQYWYHGGSIVLCSTRNRAALLILQTPENPSFVVNPLKDLGDGLSKEGYGARCGESGAGVEDT